MKAKDVFNVKLDIQGDLCFFTGRILFWWEEQNIKIDNIYEETSTQKLMVEHSKIFSKTMDKFLISVESDGKKLTRENLYQLSLEKNKNIEWSDVLHHSVVIPLYEAYINISGSSMLKMQEFRKKVIAAYDKSLRVEGFEDFPLPPELIEYDLLSTNGMLTRSDILNMSYAEILKYQTIREIDSRYKQPKGNMAHTFNNNPNQVFMNEYPDKSNLQQAAKQLFPDIVV